MIYFIIILILLLIVNISGGSSIVKSYGYLKYNSLLVSVTLLLFMGLRDMSVGTDTITYVYDIMGKSKIEWQEILWFWKAYSEPLYTFVAYVLGSITNNYTIYLLIFAVPIAFSFGFFIREYSEDYMLSTLLFMVLGIMGFCMAGLRQSVALAFCLFGYKFVRERKLIPFLLCGLIAFGFHNSSLVFLAIYPLASIKRIDLKWWIGVIVAFVLGYTKNGIVFRIASFFFTQDRYEVYTSIYSSSLNYTMLIIQGALLFFCYMNRSAILSDDDRNSSLYIMAFVGMMFQAFTPILGEFFRLSMYFSVALCILVPKTISLMWDRKLKSIMYFGTSAMSVGYMVFASSSIFHSYLPFWIRG